MIRVLHYCRGEKEKVIQADTKLIGIELLDDTGEEEFFNSFIDSISKWDKSFAVLNLKYFRLLTPLQLDNLSRKWNKLIVHIDSDVFYLANNNSYIINEIIRLGRFCENVFVVGTEVRMKYLFEQNKSIFGTYITSTEINLADFDFRPTNKTITFPPYNAI